MKAKHLPHFSEAAMKRVAAGLFFCLVFCIPAFPQDRGTIICDPGSTLPMPAWASPGGANVVEQISCGQMVTIAGFEKGYFRIQVGDRFGYVYAKYLRPIQTPEQPIAQPEAQAKELPQSIPEEQAKELQQPAPSPTPAERTAQSYVGNQEELRRHEGGLYFEVSHIYYAEPDFMRNKGFMWGFSGDYTYRPDRFMLKVDGRFSLGDVDYWSAGTGTQEDIRDYNFETRFSFGYDLTASEKTSVIPFMGLGYRYLFDGGGGTVTSSGARGYDRKSNYLYSPIGMETTFRLGRGWLLGFSGEYDLLWHGWQYSEIGDLVEDPFIPIVLPDFVAKNDQEKGWGARGSIKLVKNLGRMDFAVEPYLRYWHIEDSDAFQLFWYSYLFDMPVLDSMKEPANNTTEWGVRVGIRF
jgi:hypothetical protein